MNKAVIGIVESRAQAEAVVETLRVTQHIRVGDISVLLPDTQGTQDFAHEHHTKAPEGAAAGAGAGGVLGGTLGLLAGIGALAIPGVGPLIAAGPVLAALSGAAAGAAVGGLTGALVGLGIPEIEAKVYEGKVRGGNILIAVHVETREGQRAAEEALKQAGAHDVGATSEASLPKEARA
ncbi:MAG: hypothetical protein JWN04_1138 [Myxococcaceae bacterium]|nr:hypothetical protein [Myxococcaceae bacterium]